MFSNSHQMTAESKRAKGDVEMTYVCQLIKLSKKINDSWWTEIFIQGTELEKLPLSMEEDFLNHWQDVFHVPFSATSWPFRWPAQKSQSWSKLTWIFSVVVLLRCYWKSSVTWDLQWYWFLISKKYLARLLLTKINITNWYNCSGECRDAQALIGQGSHHISGVLNLKVAALHFDNASF